MVAVFCIAVRTFELLHSFHFIRRFTAEHTPGVIVQPLLHLCDLLRGNLCKVTAFRKPTANHAVLVLIAPTLSGVVRVTVVYCCSGFAAVYRLFKCLLIEKFRAVVASDRVKYLPELIRAISTLQAIKSTNNSVPGLVWYRHNNFVTVLTLCENKQTITTFSLSTHYGIHFPVTGSLALLDLTWAFFYGSTLRFL